nr:DUF1878 family protein [Bacillus sp. m3-13]
MEERLATLEFYMELLIKQMDRSTFPWDYLIIKGKLSRREVQALYQLCEDLSKEMEKTKSGRICYILSASYTIQTSTASRTAFGGDHCRLTDTRPLCAVDGGIPKAY